MAREDVLRAVLHGEDPVSAQRRVVQQELDGRAVDGRVRT